MVMVIKPLVFQRSASLQPKRQEPCAQEIARTQVIIWHDINSYTFLKDISNEGEPFDPCVAQKIIRDRQITFLGRLYRSKKSVDILLIWIGSHTANRKS